MNVLVVGTGGFGRLRGASFARLGHSVAFVSRDLARAREATRQLGGPEDLAATDLAQLARADAVFVATPPSCHAEAVLAAARAGKPVLVEKPVEATLARARDLRRELGDSARLVTVAENYRFLPLLRHVEELLPAVGPIEEARVVLRRARAPGGWRVQKDLSGGGVLADMGVHYVHLLRRLLGELDVASASATLEGGVDRDALLAGESERGARWSINFSWRSWRRRSSVELRGPRGMIRFRVGKDWVHRFAGSCFPAERRRIEGDEYGQRALDEDWLGAAALGRAGAVTLDEGIEDLEVVSRAYEIIAASA
ncbi:MAG TPA: Gfo/Idh/MocA family oxidoreductase [Planctomycetota bacterium]|nr:Gfo/Idh/MocA family oxidoreductase [Planctomycetota bacterium]